MTGEASGRPIGAPDAETAASGPRRVLRKGFSRELRPIANTDNPGLCIVCGNRASRLKSSQLRKA